jgi:hypothetical protein
MVVGLVIEAVLFGLFTCGMTCEQISGAYAYEPTLKMKQMKGKRKRRGHLCPSRSASGAGAWNS